MSDVCVSTVACVLKTKQKKKVVENDESRDYFQKHTANVEWWWW